MSRKIQSKESRQKFLITREKFEMNNPGRTLCFSCKRPKLKKIGNSKSADIEDKICNICYDNARQVIINAFIVHDRIRNERMNNLGF